MSPVVPVASYHASKVEEVENVSKKGDRSESGVKK